MTLVSRSFGSQGDIDYDSDFFYVCVVGNFWGKIPLLPTSFTAAGSAGDTSCAPSNFYVHNSSGWREIVLAKW